MANLGNDQNRLGELMVKANLITPQQLKKALQTQELDGGRLGEILEKLNLVNEETLTNFIAKQQGLKVINPAQIVWPDTLIKKIPKSLIEKHTFLPLAKHDDILVIAIPDPTDFNAIEEIQLAIDMRIEIVLAYRSALKKAIREVFGETAKDTLSNSVSAYDFDGSSPETVKALIDILMKKKIITGEELAEKINKQKKPNL
jgi:type II secretory ATPase GspE/PulE/Tfp pilus assembly ATPase PilB-like protein